MILLYEIFCLFSILGDLLYVCICFLFCERKTDSKKQKSIQSGTRPVPGYQMGSNKFTIEVSLFPSGDHKAAMNKLKSMTNTGHK